jgi:glucose-6-phosphate isomerase
MRALCEAHQIPLLDHHTGIGGRYSVLSNVGLLVALARGQDPLAIRAGAKTVIEDMLGAGTPSAFAPAIGAAACVALAETRNIKVLVMMPYADRLGRFAHWYVQLWAESLGKGGMGTTPLAAVGPLDQHSQLQLFMEGAREHMLTLVRLPGDGVGPRLDASLANLAGIGFLAGRHVGDLVSAQSLSVAEALRQAGRPVRIVELPRLDERVIGALIMHFMLETILAGHLLGVDPFDQPGVELAKRLAKERLAKS